MDDNLRITGAQSSTSRNWIDNRDFYASAKAASNGSGSISTAFRLTDPKSEDKMEQLGRLADYQVENAVPNTLENQMLKDAREEYIRDDRQMSKESVVFQAFYKGGIGVNFDTKA